MCSLSLGALSRYTAMQVHARRDVAEDDFEMQDHRRHMIAPAHAHQGPT
ncbi:MAG: hypothetical protein MUF73_03360 [Rhodobacteraceae bacterium]|nr:hypothetical protein [Paracoccaceae bacterium]